MFVCPRCCQRLARTQLEGSVFWNCRASGGRAATLAGALLHILPNPDSTIPVIGTSGGISGILAFYGLQFPRARLGLMIRYPLFLAFRWIRLRAWVYLLFWVLLQSVGAWQQVSGVTQVSFLAHLGGATVGFLSWFLGKETQETPGPQEK